MRARCSLLMLAVALFAAVPVTAQHDLGTEKQRAAGKALYDKFCSQCHGDEGDGRGVAYPYVHPKPRDFTSAKYKIRTTPSGALPSDRDMREIIRRGMPYTSMPAWPQFSETELQEIVFYLKTFSPEFADAEPEVAMEVPAAPPLTDDSVAEGRKIYEEFGCKQCHGELARGDGPSAPTLVDDFNDYIRAADLTAKWTFRGGTTRSDLFRTLTTGINGTPMPSYADAMTDEQRWNLVDYVYSLSSSEAAPYSELLIVKPVAAEIELERGVELFEDAPRSMFPIIGQIVQPGRNFHPLVNNARVRAVHSPTEIAFLLQWNDQIADTSGSNDPSREVPLFDPAAETTGGADDAGGGDDFWGDAAEDEGGGDDFWGDEEEGGTTGSGSEFSDAVAIQIPAAIPEGIRKPYFIFGDAQAPVDLWFVDLADGEARQFVGRGSRVLEPVAGPEISSVSSYEDGQWSVIFKRPLRSLGGVSLAERQFLPIAFSVWDGFNEERGNRRGLTQWFYAYVEPREKESALLPMIKVGFGIFLVEVIVVFWLRFRHRRDRGVKHQAQRVPALR